MKSITRIITLSLVILITACDSLLEIEPRQSIDSSRALTTQEGIRSNLANIYSYLKNVLMYGRDFVATSEALADNARIINRAGGRYQAQGTNVPSSHFGNWALSYSGINETNLLLAALPQANITAAYRDEVEAQVRALRALFYFDLMRAYAYEPGIAPPDANRGGVPLVTTGILAPSEIELLPRASQEEVYQQMYDDLTIATEKALVNGGPIYLNKAAIHALFAKIALYNRDWETAEDQATEALAIKGTLTTTVNYVSSWRTAVHPESYYEVTFTNTGESIGVNESVQSAFTTRVSLTSTSLAGYGAVVPTTDFLNLFVTGDVRRDLYQLGVARSAVTVIECTKFMGKTGTIYMDNIPLIRVSEVYLIRAEARARQGTNDAGALSDLNAVTTRAGVTAYAGLTGTTLVDAVIAQRRLELAFEGDRWYDLKRRGVDVIKATGNVPYVDFRILAPIPVREIQSNPNLQQNIGY